MLVPSWLVWVMVLVGIVQLAALWGSFNEYLTSKGRPLRPLYVYLYIGLYRVSFWWVSVIGAILHGMDAALFRYRKDMLEPLPDFLCEREPSGSENGSTQE